MVKQPSPEQHPHRRVTCLSSSADPDGYSNHSSASVCPVPHDSDGFEDTGQLPCWICLHFFFLLFSQVWSHVIRLWHKYHRSNAVLSEQLSRWHTLNPSCYWGVVTTVVSTILLHIKLTHFLWGGTLNPHVSSFLTWYIHLFIFILFKVMDSNFILCIIIPYEHSLFWCWNYWRFGQWELRQVEFWVLWGCLCHFAAPQDTPASSFTFLALDLRISRFFKELFVC